MARLSGGALLFLVLWFGAACPAHADNNTELSLGISARASLGRVAFFRGAGQSGLSTYSYKTGYAFGIAPHIDVLKWGFLETGLQPEILFVQRGTKVEFEGDVVATFALSYLELPILGRMLLEPPGPFRPYIVAGPRLGFLLNAESTDVNGNVRDRSESTKTLDAGFSIGAGTVLKVSPRFYLTLEGRYDQSLMSLVISAGGETNDQRNRAFFFTFGIGMNVWPDASSMGGHTH